MSGLKKGILIADCGVVITIADVRISSRPLCSKDTSPSFEVIVSGHKKGAVIASLISFTS
jgi:hypothetical protein